MLWNIPKISHLRYKRYKQPFSHKHLSFLLLEDTQKNMQIVILLTNQTVQHNSFWNLSKGDLWRLQSTDTEDSFHEC